MLGILLIIEFHFLQVCESTYTSPIVDAANSIIVVFASKHITLLFSLPPIDVVPMLRRTFPLSLFFFSPSTNDDAGAVVRNLLKYVFVSSSQAHGSSSLGGTEKSFFSSFFMPITVASCFHSLTVAPTTSLYLVSRSICVPTDSWATSRPIMSRKIRQVGVWCGSSVL